MKCIELNDSKKLAGLLARNKDLDLNFIFTEDGSFPLLSATLNGW